MQFKRWLEMSLDLSDLDDPFHPGFPEALKKKKIIVYHGTTTKSFWPIVRKGLAFDKARQNYEKVTSGIYFSLQPMGANGASMYSGKAVKTMGGKEIIFVAEIPMSLLSKDMDDAEAWDANAKLQVMVDAEKVSPKYITGVIYPVDDENWKEIPIRQFINKAMKDNVSGIAPQKTRVGGRFSSPTMLGIEHSILKYVQDLLNYTSFRDHLLGTDFNRLARRLFEVLQKPGMVNMVMQWDGDKWVEFFEKFLNEKNEETYYKTQRQFQIPMGDILHNKYTDYDNFRQFRLGK